MIDMRQVAHPRDVKRYDTNQLRADFLIENLFEAMRCASPSAISNG